MTEEGTVEFRFGEGRISGALSATLGALGLGAVLCLLFPHWLTTPDLRGLYPMDLVRALIQGVLGLAVGFGLLAVVLDHRSVSGFAGMGLGALATLLGGSRVPIETPLPESRYIGLDWFVLDLFFLALIFVPLERIFARRSQRLFRSGWKTDLTHFFVSHVGVQVTVLLTMLPAALLFRFASGSGFQARVAAQPMWLQLFECVVLADLFAYFAHRLFHEIPLLWRFHRIHHSSEELDWLASSRLHLVDILVTRAVGFVPLYVMGFSPEALYPYLVFASIQAIFIHANLRFRPGPLRYLLVTPQFHHWHHTADPDAIDKNFAVHLPVIDWLFGTYHLPGHDWPERYGLPGRPVGNGWLYQLLLPFRREGGEGTA